MKSTAKRTAKVWKLEDAKNRLGKLVDEAKAHGPQFIRRHGVEAAVVLSLEDYTRLVKPRGTLIDFLTNSPLAGSELEIDRSKDTGRAIDL